MHMKINDLELNFDDSAEKIVIVKNGQKIQIDSAEAYCLSNYITMIAEMCKIKRENLDRLEHKMEGNTIEKMMKTMEKEIKG